MRQDAARDSKVGAKSASYVNGRRRALTRVTGGVRGRRTVALPGLILASVPRLEPEDVSQKSRSNLADEDAGVINGRLSINWQRLPRAEES
jgi:hypothetical protein